MPEERYDDSFRSVERRPRVPSPGLAGVLSVFIPGLGHVYSGRLLAGLGWFLGTALGYALPLLHFVGFFVHVASVYFAYQAAKEFRGYD
jgi:hypothetical protein